MTNDAIHAFTQWLSMTPLSQLIQNIVWIIPTVQTIHIAFIALVIGAIGMVNLRTLGIGIRSQSTSTLAHRLLPFVWWSLPVLLATGLILIIGEPVRSLENITFQIKMLLLICGILATFTFQKAMSKDAAFWEMSAGRRAAAKFLAVLSLVIWVGIIFAGRYIAYTITEYD